MFSTVLSHVFFITTISHLSIFCYANPLIGPNVRKAEPNEFNSVVSLSFTNRNNTVEKNHFCGGVLISKKHVLTSAHCKLGKNFDVTRDVVVKIGSIDLRQSQEYNIKNWITFKEWKKRKNLTKGFLSTDISVIELTKSVDPSIKPAVIAKFDSNYDLVGKNVVTAGWGTTKDGVYPRYMLTASLKIISDDECNRNMNKADGQNKKQRLKVGTMCTNSEPYAVIACGDSGSPLLINGNEVIGINDSSGPVQGDRCVPFEQNVHLRVDYYEFFINDIVNKKRLDGLCWRHPYIFCYANPLIGPNVRKAEPNEFNFVAFLSLTKRNNAVEKNHFCGGVLISRRHVLTSAHCKPGKKYDVTRDVVVKIGSIDLRQSQEYNIKSWITYREWKEQKNLTRSFLDTDISVIELSKRVNPSIKPAVIAKFDNNYDLVGKKVVTAGWGTTNDGAYPRYLVTVSLKVISDEECIRNMNEADGQNIQQRLNIGTMCTNANPYAVLGCGDSGSPLLMNGNVVIGIDDSCCPVQGEKYVPLQQNVHLKVDYYEFFINDVVNIRKSNWLCWPGHSIIKI